MSIVAAQSPVKFPSSNGQSLAPNATVPQPNPNSGEIWGILRKRTNLHLSPLQFEAIELATRGTNETRIAQILGIDRKTLWNWKTYNDDYRAALAEASATIHANVINNYQAALMKATDVLAEYLDDSVHDTRIRVAQILLRAAAALKPPARRPARPVLKPNPATTDVLLPGESHPGED
jgi:hypothetical protein